MSSDDVIRILGLVPLEIEGGHFRETYRCLTASETPGHSCGTCIYYMIRGNFMNGGSSVSKWHKVVSDEIWFFHAGSTAEQFLLFDHGTREKRILGADILKGEIPQSIIPAGTWQFTRLADQNPDSWALFSTVVCPGFEYEDFVFDDNMSPP